MAVYWTIARVGEHPAKARQENSAGGHALHDDSCQSFRTGAELAASSLMRSVIVEEEDLTGDYEVAKIHGDTDTERKPDAGLGGVHVVCQHIEERVPVLEWLEGLTNEEGEAKAAGEKALLEYRMCREMFEEG